MINKRKPKVGDLINITGIRPESTYQRRITKVNKGFVEFAPLKEYSVDGIFNYNIEWYGDTIMGWTYADEDTETSTALMANHHNLLNEYQAARMRFEAVNKDLKRYIDKEALNDEV